MEKYEKPVMEVIDIKNDVILTSSVSDINSGDAGIGYGGGGSGGAR